MTQTLTLDIGPMAHGGHCVARHEGRVVFVRHAIPGETVRARVTEGGPGAKYWRADVVEVLSPSDYRRRHIWKLADSLRAHENDRLPVGGAEFGHITDQHQRRLKGQVFRDTMQRIGGFSIHDQRLPLASGDGEVHVHDVLSDGPYHGLHWRTRASFAVSALGALSMKPHRSNELIELRGMPLAVSSIHESGIFGFNFKGVDRVDAVAAGAGPQVTLVVHVRRGLPAVEREELNERLLHLHQREPAIANIVLATSAPEPNPSRGRAGARGAGRRGRGERSGPGARAQDQASAPRPERISYTVVAGSRTVTEPLPLPQPPTADSASPAGTFSTVEIQPEDFWQIHRNAPRCLVEAVNTMTQVPSGASVADLYAGAGLFSAWAAELAGAAGSVLSVEGAPGSSASAAQLFAGSPQVEVLQAPVEAVLDRLAQRDLILLDPPRTGAGERVIAGIDAAGPREVLYVSCEPSSFARDAKSLMTRGWELADLKVFDLYPNTHHMESVALFRAPHRR
ncbi:MULTISPECIES: class I SAM-dependent RNA methyltransferase [unclassified Nesterenkonia]|uniref:class I SAM-dependent RNA methyltransferase n=1 Tax=unclassified Nesterenkonia TaxID=2629769 RepID=UPI001F4C9EB0|nr:MULTISPECIES: TRAM domain-containing protein [unclassified Nesterenkonia]MCH8561294.1 class I SAM-dependent RNA methyltransferase [Nesterenkonia sp. DZ6]MCH8562392.1 class I SAM-dependent RNA methyltransferase [Nesterenkonia sp. YGD6]MCH8571246.1 class I SAM-dependent RNA methyltransferase [Nesterenkonia sp. AY15]